jgi:hypothetical protein
MLQRMSKQRPGKQRKEILMWSNFPSPVTGNVVMILAAGTATIASQPGNSGLWNATAVFFAAPWGVRT